MRLSLNQQRLGLFATAAICILVAFLLWSTSRGSSSGPRVEEEHAFARLPFGAVVFDDGPWTSEEAPQHAWEDRRLPPRNPEYVERIINALRSAARPSGVSFFFSFNGIHADKYADLIRSASQVATVVNHSYNHADFSALSLQECVSDFERTQAALTRATGLEPRHFHYPFCRANATFTEYLSSLGIEVLNDGWRVCVGGAENLYAGTDDCEPSGVPAQLREEWTDPKEQDLLILHNCAQTSRDIALIFSALTHK